MTKQDSTSATFDSIEQSLEIQFNKAEEKNNYKMSASVLEAGKKTFQCKEM